MGMYGKRLSPNTRVIGHCREPSLAVELLVQTSKTSWIPKYSKGFNY